jgi:hypothetical protein
LALYPKLEDANYIGHVLPRAPLGRLRAAVISPDSRFLAISDRDRGAMWDLQTGERLFHVRAFRGGWFDNAGTLHTIYPPVPAKYRASPAGGDDEGAGDSKKKEDKPKKPENLTGLWTMDPKTRTDHLVRSFDSSERVNQVGPYILVVKTEGKNNFWGAAQPETLEFQDVNSEKLLWSRRFAKGAPDAFVHPQSATVVLVWSLAQEGARELVSHDAALEQQVENIPHANTGYLVEVLEAQSGKRKAMFPVDTRSRSFRVESARAVGDRIFVSDNTGRVLVYSLTGEQKGRVFGRHLVASSEGKSFAVEPSPGHVVVYDAETLRRRDEFTFTTSAARIWFTDDGKRLAVLTADQVFYILEPAKVPAASASIH